MHDTTARIKRNNANTDLSSLKIVYTQTGYRTVDIFFYRGLSVTEFHWKQILENCSFTYFFVESIKIHLFWYMKYILWDLLFSRLLYVLRCTRHILSVVVLFQLHYIIFGIHQKSLKPFLFFFNEFKFVLLLQIIWLWY